MDFLEFLLVVLLVQFWAIVVLFYRLNRQVPTVAETKKEEETPKLRTKEEDEELKHRRYIASTEELIGEVPNSTVTRRTKSNFEYYIVYKVPADSTVPLGIYKCTWDRFQLLFPEKRWIGSGVQIKGAKSFNDAVSFWGHHVTLGVIH